MKELNQDPVREEDQKEEEVTKRKNPWENT